MFILNGWRKGRFLFAVISVRSCFWGWAFNARRFVLTWHIFSRADEKPAGKGKMRDPLCQLSTVINLFQSKRPHLPYVRITAEGCLTVHGKAPISEAVRRHSSASSVVSFQTATQTWAWGQLSTLTDGSYKILTTVFVTGRCRKQQKGMMRLFVWTDTVNFT